MKISLVVAQGVHTGKVIPIGSTSFLIGRDPHCNLRPASPSISKQHCGIIVRNGKVYVVDYGSTNGTLVNEVPVQGEIEVKDQDKLKAGPLEFVLHIEVTAVHPAIKKVGSPPVATETAAVAMADTHSVVSASPAITATAEDESDKMAAMLLALDDGAGSGDPTTEAKIPDGTTVMDIPAVPGAPAKPSQLDKVKQEKADSSKAAADILSKYMRRPRS